MEPHLGQHAIQVSNMQSFNRNIKGPNSVTRLDDFWTLGNFLKPLATKNLPKSPTFLGIFCKGVKIFQVKSFLGNFYRHLAIFFWSHWETQLTTCAIYVFDIMTITYV